MATDTALELIRDQLTAIRADVSKVFDKLEDAVSSNQSLHRDIDARLVSLEHPVCTCVKDQPSGILARLPWLPVAAKIGWPAALIFVVLWRSAPEPTKHQVKSIAADAAGIKLPDGTSGASAQPQITPASTTWVAPRWGGPR